MGLNIDYLKERRFDHPIQQATVNKDTSRL